MMQQPECLWFIFYRDTLLLFGNESTGLGVPRCAAPPLPPAGMTHALGMCEGIPCLAYGVADAPAGLQSFGAGDLLIGRTPSVGGTPTGMPIYAAGNVPAGHHTGVTHGVLAGSQAGVMSTVPSCRAAGTQIRSVDLRTAWKVLPSELYALAGKGRELLHWEAHTRFCPACGEKTVAATAISKSCPGCGYQMFPHIATAILALVQKDDAIFLARAHTFTGPFYSCVAGFLDPGEGLEDCVAREVWEETGLQVGNIRYAGCQAWPFPSGLMVGFTSDWQAGEIVLQKEELIEGGFYSRGALPELPPEYSLARWMIDRWIAGKADSA